MTQNRKILGMTMQQIVILVGMAVGACLLFAIAGLLFLQGRSRLATSAPQQYTPVPQMTATPFALPTLLPTETPTAIPYELLIPEGWVQFKTELVEIWLPKEFEKKKNEATNSTLTTELTMVGYTSESSQDPMIAIVSYEPLIGDSLDAYVDAFISDPAEEMIVAQKGKVSVNSVEAVQIVLEMRLDDGDIVNDLVYIFQDGSTIWYIQYMAQINEFFVVRPTFEQSVKTFRIVR